MAFIIRDITTAGSAGNPSPTSSGVASAAGVPNQLTPSTKKRKAPGDDHQLCHPVLCHPFERPADGLHRVGPLHRIEKQHRAENDHDGGQRRQQASTTAEPAKGKIPPISTPSGPAQSLFPVPPANRKFLAAATRGLALGRSERSVQKLRATAIRWSGTTTLPCPHAGHRAGRADQRARSEIHRGPNRLLEYCLQSPRTWIRSDDPSQPRFASFASKSRSSCNLNPRRTSGFSHSS